MRLFFLLSDEVRAPLHLAGRIIATPRPLLGAGVQCLHTLGLKTRLPGRSLSSRVVPFRPANIPVVTTFLLRAPPICLLCDHRFSFVRRCFVPRPHRSLRRSNETNHNPGHSSMPTFPKPERQRINRESSTLFGALGGQSFQMCFAIIFSPGLFPETGGPLKAVAAVAVGQSSCRESDRYPICFDEYCT